MSGAPGKIRTPDPLIRSQVLYPAELPVRRVSPILGEAALKRKPIRIASAFLRLSLLSYRPEIFVKLLKFAR